MSCPCLSTSTIPSPFRSGTRHLHFFPFHLYFFSIDCTATKLGWLSAFSHFQLPFLCSCPPASRCADIHPSKHRHHVAMNIQQWGVHGTSQQQNVPISSSHATCRLDAIQTSFHGDEKRCSKLMLPHKLPKFQKFVGASKIVLFHNNSKQWKQMLKSQFLLAGASSATLHLGRTYRWQWFRSLYELKRHVSQQYTACTSP